MNSFSIQKYRKLAVIIWKHYKMQRFKHNVKSECKMSVKHNKNKLQHRPYLFKHLQRKMKMSKSPHINVSMGDCHHCWNISLYFQWEKIPVTHIDGLMQFLESTRYFITKIAKYEYHPIARRQNEERSGKFRKITGVVCLKRVNFIK